MATNDEEKTGFEAIGDRIKRLDKEENTSESDSEVYENIDTEKKAESITTTDNCDKENQSNPNGTISANYSKPANNTVRNIILGIIAIIIIAVLFSEDKNKNTSSNQYYKRPSNSSPDPMPNQNVPPSKEPEMNESKPPIGRDHILSIPQIRYCVYENFRLDQIKANIPINNDYLIAQYNGRVNDYNSRCSKYLYRQGNLQRIQSELGKAKGRLQLEAVAIIIAWRDKEPFIPQPNNKKNADTQRMYTPPAANSEAFLKKSNQIYLENRGQSPSTTEIPDKKERLIDPSWQIDAESCRKQGEQYYKEGQYYKAIEEMTKAIVKIKNAEIYTKRGLAYYKTNQHEKAIDDFTNAIDLAPSYRLAYFNRGVTFNDKGQFDKALKDFQKACDLGDSDGCIEVKKLSHH